MYWYSEYVTLLIIVLFQRKELYSILHFCELPKGIGHPDVQRTELVFDILVILISGVLIVVHQRFDASKADCNIPGGSIKSYST